eukprot:Rmarinus@m.28953
MDDRYVSIGTNFFAVEVESSPCLNATHEWLRDTIPYQRNGKLVPYAQDQFTPVLASTKPNPSILPSCAINRHPKSFYQRLLHFALSDIRSTEPLYLQEQCSSSKDRVEALKYLWHTFFFASSESGKHHWVDYRIPLSLRADFAIAIRPQGSMGTMMDFIADAVQARRELEPNLRLSVCRLAKLGFADSSRLNDFRFLDFGLDAFEVSPDEICYWVETLVVISMTVDVPLAAELFAHVATMRNEPTACGLWNVVSGFLSDPPRHTLTQWANPLVLERMIMSRVPLDLRPSKALNKKNSLIFSYWDICEDQPYRPLYRGARPVDMTRDLRWAPSSAPSPPLPPPEQSSKPSQPSQSPSQRSQSQLSSSSSSSSSSLAAPPPASLAVSMVYTGRFGASDPGFIIPWYVYARNQSVIGEAYQVYVVEEDERAMILRVVEMHNLYPKYRGVYLPISVHGRPEPPPDTILGTHYNGPISLGLPPALSIALIDACTPYIVFPSADDMRGNARFVETVVRLAAARSEGYVVMNGPNATGGRRVVLIKRDFLLLTHRKLQEGAKLSPLASWDESVISFWDSLGYTGIVFSPTQRDAESDVHVSADLDVPVAVLHPDVEHVSKFASQIFNDTEVRLIQDEVASTFDCSPIDPRFLIYNRVPKAGSTTLFTHMFDSATSLNYPAKICEALVTSNMTFVQGLSAPLGLNRCFRKLNPSAPGFTRGIIVKHQYFIPPDELQEWLQDFGVTLEGVAAEGIELIKYMNLLREPIARLSSEYNYFRYGPRPEYQHKIYASQPHTNVTFDECIRSVFDGSPANVADCAGQNHQLRYLCGTDPSCFDGSREGLERAKDNVRRHYPVVGVLDQLDDTVWLLQRVLPGYFDGYERDVSHRNRTRKKLPLAEDVEKIVRAWNRLDIELYEWVRIRFEAMLAICRDRKE